MISPSHCPFLPSCSLVVIPGVCLSSLFSRIPAVARTIWCSISPLNHLCFSLFLFLFYCIHLTTPPLYQGSAPFLPSSILHVPAVTKIFQGSILPFPFFLFNLVATPIQSSTTQEDTKTASIRLFTLTVWSCTSPSPQFFSYVVATPPHSFSTGQGSIWDLLFSTSPPSWQRSGNSLHLYFVSSFNSLLTTWKGNEDHYSHR